MTDSVFGSNNVINENILGANLRGYFVGYDIGVYRYDHLVDHIMDAIVDFCYGYHSGILSSYNRRDLIEAAKSLYKIKSIDGDLIFEEVRRLYMEDEGELSDDLPIDKNYLRRGEFGELIMHLVLRDFIRTVPLISKIYTKDSDGMTVHGFDAVHIGECLSQSGEKSLYLGETKLYTDGKKGVKALIEDIKSHFVRDFLGREFVLIGKKRNNFKPIEEYFDENNRALYEQFMTERNYWFDKLDAIQNGSGKLGDLFRSVTIPLFCMYKSSIFDRYTDEQDESFLAELQSEIEELNQVFITAINSIKDEYAGSGELIGTDLNFVLMLFPVPSKKELVKRLHTKLYHQQSA